MNSTCGSSQVQGAKNVPTGAFVTPPSRILARRISPQPQPQAAVLGDPHWVSYPKDSLITVSKYDNISMDRFFENVSPLNETLGTEGLARASRVVVVVTPEVYRIKGLTSCLCEKAGFGLLPCSNAFGDLLSYCHRHAPCVLIIGQELAEGGELAELSKVAQFGRLVKILVVGSDVTEAKVQSLIRAGCMGFLHWGCSKSLLRRAVRTLAAGELWASRRVVCRVIQDFLLAQNLHRLSPRESEILHLIGLGYKNREIAERLFISGETVRWHVRGLYGKIGVKDRLSAAVYAAEHAKPGLRIPPEVSQPDRALAAAG